MNILTIDFDWIMSDSIECYNDLISTSTTRSNWADFRKTMPGLNFNPSWELFHTVKKICEIYRGKLYKIIDHAEILQYINQPIDTLINIDHHHDYFKSNGLQPFCGDWVRRLDNKKWFKSYIWIPNPTSDIQDLEKKNYFYIAKPDPMLTLQKYSIAQVYLCQSPQWLPWEAIELWDLFVATLDFNN